MQEAITLSESAVSRLKDLMAGSVQPVLGVRIGVENSGCSGLSYAMELATEKKTDEETIEHNGIKIFLDPAAMMFLIGTELDYQQNKMGASFVFHNPNEKGRCGCGESFRV
ncbi:Iron binding protein IscA for iron-sulfur cluster assembly [invertebrate metagenome]|uniref:Iron binding protein IscA for iron-sulfur cluster assembly n=1 Tax=invertebrate metagenome TaxID=1711999 RepID=A0A484HA37_9ZZZZ